MRALLILAVIALTGCASWQTTTNRSLIAVSAASDAARVFVLKRCGAGGSTVFEKCKTAGDAACKPLHACHNATRALLSIEVAVLSGKLAIQASDKPGATSFLSAAVQALGPLQLALKSWGVKW